MLHHLRREEKLRTLRELWRVLEPGGTLHVLDFGMPSGRLGRRLASLALRGERIRDNLEGRIVGLLEESGFADAEETGRHRSLATNLSFFRGSKPP